MDAAASLPALGRKRGRDADTSASLPLSFTSSSRPQQKHKSAHAASHDARRLLIENGCGTSVSLADFSIVAKGETFRFPELALEPGESVALFAGPGAVATATATAARGRSALVWTTRRLFAARGNVDPEEEVVELFDSNGALVDVVRSKSVVEPRLQLAVDLEDEIAYLSLRADAPFDIALGGWTLTTGSGSSFVFPATSELRRGQRVAVHSGQDAQTRVDRVTGSLPSASASASAPSDFVWTRRAMWNNKGTTATLRDAAGGVVLDHVAGLHHEQLVAARATAEKPSKPSGGGGCTIA